MCFGWSKEPSRLDVSFEYPQRMFWLRNKKIIFSYALLSGGSVFFMGELDKAVNQYFVNILLHVTENNLS